MPLDFVRLPNTKVALANQGIYNGMLGVLIIAVNCLLTGAALKTVLALLMLYIFIVAFMALLPQRKRFSSYKAYQR